MIVARRSTDPPVAGARSCRHNVERSSVSWGGGGCITWDTETVPMFKCKACGAYKCAGCYPVTAEEEQKYDPGRFRRYMVYGESICLACRNRSCAHRRDERVGQNCILCRLWVCTADCLARRGDTLLTVCKECVSFLSSR